MKYFEFLETKLLYKSYSVFVHVIYNIYILLEGSQDGYLLIEGFGEGPINPPPKRFKVQETEKKSLQKILLQVLLEAKGEASSS